MVLAVLSVSAKGKEHDFGATESSWMSLALTEFSRSTVTLQLDGDRHGRGRPRKPAVPEAQGAELGGAPGFSHHSHSLEGAKSHGTSSHLPGESGVRVFQWTLVAWHDVPISVIGNLGRGSPYSNTCYRLKKYSILNIYIYKRCQQKETHVTFLCIVA